MPGASAEPSVVYFADENLLGMGKLLCRAGRPDVLHPGHEALPEIPRGTADLDWMPVVGARGFVVLSRDRRIRTRPVELRAYWEHGIRSVWLGAKQDMSPSEHVGLFLRYEARLQREITKRGAGPWALAMSPSGIRPLQLREPDETD